MPTRRPVNEAQRLAALRRYSILDTAPEQALDRITELTALLFRVPIALISLVDHDRIWFKSHYGIAIEQVERIPGLCASAILSGAVYHVAVANTDERTRNHPLVFGEFGLRFYAGAPLTTPDGYNLGTLCVIDRQARGLSFQESLYLQNLAAITVDQFELRLQVRGPLPLAPSELNEGYILELQSLDRLKDEFLSTVSHELRTPVSNMWVAIKLLKAARSDQKKRQYLQIIESECGREIDLINELLDLQQLEARVRPLKLQPVTLGDWLPPLLAPFYLSTREHDHRFEVEIDPQLAPLVNDSEALEFIVTELVNNACKYTPPGESIRLRAWGLPATWNSGPRLELTVTNTGVEIAQRELARIFDKFYRTPAADPWRQQGMGLGLALLKQWVLRLGGTVTARSDRQAVTFSVYLPTIVSNGCEPVL